MIKNIITIIGICTLGGMAFMSCDGNEALPTYESPNQSDTTGSNIGQDLFISGEIDNIPFTLFNGKNGYSNWTISNEDGFCMGAPNKFVQIHTTSFIIPSALKTSLYVDIRGCVNVDSVQNINKVDSVLVVGEYDFYPKNDTGRSAIIRYIDADSVLWSTAFGGNVNSFARFELSAIIENGYDTYSKKIAFGKFEGYVYDGKGDSLRVKLGQFKGRIVQ